LVDFPNLSTSSYANSLIIGQPINIIKAFHLLGVDPATGKYQFAGTDGSPTFYPNYSNDRRSLINTDPTYYGGLQNNFNYKGFELSFLLQFVKQRGQFNNAGVYPGNEGINQFTNVLNRWQKPGDIASHQRFGQDNSLFLQYYYAAFFSDYGYEDASYIRLKNVSIAWQIPGDYMHKYGITTCKLYAQAQNVFTITNYKGLDPESRSSVTLPPLRVVTIGIQAGF
jgi:hypothetical protein